MGRDKPRDPVCSGFRVTTRGVLISGVVLQWDKPRDPDYTVCPGFRVTTRGVLISGVNCNGTNQGILIIRCVLDSG